MIGIPNCLFGVTMNINLSGLHQRPMLVNAFVIASLLGCASAQGVNASEKATSTKKSSTPVKAKAATEFDATTKPFTKPSTNPSNKPPAPAAAKDPDIVEKPRQGITKKMNKQEQELFSREDLASRLNIPLEQTSISGAIQVTWRSGALGCPKPGMNYTDALVPGVLIMVKVGNVPYRYHASPGGKPFHCPDSMAESQYLNSSDI